MQRKTVQNAGLMILLVAQTNRSSSCKINDPQHFAQYPRTTLDQRILNYYAAACEGLFIPQNLV
jgi:hypothetical protein